MTEIRLASGFQWSHFTLDEQARLWGGGDFSHLQILSLSNLVVSQFNAQARAAGSSARWMPMSSEVVGDPDDPATDEQLTNWRVSAVDQVRDAVMGEPGATELTSQVQAIVGD